MEWVVILLLGLQGYFSIFMLTPRADETNKNVRRVKSDVLSFWSGLIELNATIKTLDTRLNNLETTIKLKGLDSSRLIEWLNKRDQELADLHTNFKKHLNLEGREKAMEKHQSEIVKLGSEIRLIRERKN